METGPNPAASSVEDWRRDFAYIRVLQPLPIQPQLVFLSPRSRRRNFAVSVLGLVVISRDLLCAPEDVRAYLIAHEIGHTIRGHSLSSALWVGSVALGIAGMAFSPWMAEAFLFFDLIGLFVWVRRLEQRREFEADDAAAEVCGDPLVIKGLLWMATRRGETSLLDAKRLARSRLRLDAAVSASLTGAPAG